MNRIFLLFKREIKKYFDSPLAYIIIIVFLIMSGWMFSSTIFLINRVTIENFIINVPLLLIFFVPAIAMQLLAEEFNSGTIEILGSLPIKDREIIGGKFLAAFTLLFSAIILTLIYPISISFLGDLDWGQVTGSYIGMLLIGGTFLSIGILASSLSSNQVIAFIIGFAVSFAFFIMGKVTDILPSYIRPVIEYMGIDSHWENLSRGVIDMRDIIYFFSLWIFFIYSSLIAFGRRIRLGFYSISSVGLLSGVLILFNILTSGIVYRMDLTEHKIYSISKASKNIIKALDDPVLIKVYFSKNLPLIYQQRRKYLSDLLHEYRAYSDSRVKFKFLDPSEDESAAREAMANGIPPLKFTEAGKERLEIKQGFMGVMILYQDKKEVIPVVENIEGLEYDLTTRIKKITSKQQRQVGYIGDLGISEELRFNISARYQFERIESSNTLDEKNFVSVVVKTNEDFNDEQIDILRKIAQKKIPLGILADIYKIDMKNFRATKLENKINVFLNAYGIDIEQGLILDLYSQRIGVTTQSGFFTIQNIVDYPYFPRVIDLDKNNPVVRDLKSISFPFVSPLKIIDEKNPEFDVRILAKTSNNSWLDDNPGYMTPMRNYSPPDSASRGPFPVICMIKEKNSLFRMIVVSNSRFIDPKFLVTPSNESLFLNLIDWLTEDHDLITIRSKGISDRPMKELTSAKKTAIKYIDIFLVPFLVLGVGIYRWNTRNVRNLKKKIRLLGS